MFAIKERFSESKISLDSHYESHTSRAVAEITPQQPRKAEYLNVILIEIVSHYIIFDEFLRDQSHQTHQIKNH